MICQGCLVGMVMGARPTGDSLDAARINKLAQDSSFVDLIEKAIGRKLTFETIARTESFDNTVNSVIEGIATVDASNTQQVAALELGLSKAYQERVLSQARESFIAALISACIGLLFFLAAVTVVLVNGLVNAALISTISGAIVEAEDRHPPRQATYPAPAATIDQDAGSSQGLLRALVFGNLDG